MTQNLEDLRKALEADGLYCGVHSDTQLFVGSDLVQSDFGSPVAKNFCTVAPIGDQWVAQFWTIAPSSSDVIGTLSELEDLIRAVFRHQATEHVTLFEAFASVKGDPWAYRDASLMRGSKLAEPSP